MSTPAEHYEATYKTRRERHLGRIERYKGHILEHEAKIKDMNDEELIKKEKAEIEEARVKIDVAAEKFTEVEKEHEMQVKQQLQDAAGQFLEEAGSSMRVLRYQEVEEE
ncbi:hypothetical protein E8E11_006626 [Didymella keratinophila]|nr:hypothetical protein E8E11_006626 [Didymella keratinophila]